MENEERETVELQVDEEGNARVADLEETAPLEPVAEPGTGTAQEGPQEPACPQDGGPGPQGSKRAPLGRNAKLCLAVVVALAVGCAGAAGGMAWQRSSDAAEQAAAAALAAQEAQKEADAAEDDAADKTSGSEDAESEDAADDAESDEATDEGGEEAAEEKPDGDKSTDKSKATWSKRYVMVTHPEKSHKVKRAAVYENVTEKHTLCNVCQAEIDGKTDEHAEKTGHTGYTTDVPVTKRQLKTEAYTETVVDQEAYTELVEDGEVSSTGKVRGNKYDKTSVTLDS